MARRPAKKKHRGIKDPYKQIEERFNKIKHKINRKPANDESQEISRSLQKIADFQKEKNKKPDTEILKAIKERKKLKKKRKKKGEDLLIDTARLVPIEKAQPGMQRPLKMIPRLVQYSGETDQDFVKRVQRASKAIIHESQFEDKYKVEIERDEKTGAVSKVKGRKMLDDPLLPEKKRIKLEEREKLKKDKKKERDFKRKHKNQKDDEDEDEFKYFQDKVEFGEVVYEPPSLDTSKLRKITNTDPKAKSFLFSEKLKALGAEKTPELTASRKRILEEERLKAVQAYRDMKAAQYKAQNKSFSFG